MICSATIWYTVKVCIPIEDIPMILERHEILFTKIAGAIYESHPVGLRRVIRIYEVTCFVIIVVDLKQKAKIIYKCLHQLRQAYHTLNT